MHAEKARQYGATAGMLLMLVAWSGNWLITPMSHPSASSTRQMAVVIQAVVSLLLAAWCWRRAGQAVRWTQGSSEPGEHRGEAPRTGVDARAGRGS